ncbi:PREDICTED: uncharacterized protein LOC107349932 [Acropora digitifera]|uniref:uncharacterized protein LOC107349932 n=1 Tax=Acropora digitifera TaxID=70779 RepID=UPI00077A48DB|nr:PREDICTED: uncharacterized protein LOC107349932 [Acropora digitifera]
MSQSETFRNNGDKCFHRATLVDTNSSPVKARNFYEQALFLFYKAKEKAEDRKDEVLGALKIGEAASKIADVLKPENDGPETIIFYLHEAIKGFLVAYNHVDMEWRTEVLKKLLPCYQQVITVAESLGSLDQNIAQMEKLCNVNTVAEAASDIQLILGTLYYNDGVNSFGNGNYIKCLKRMNDCNQSIEEVKRLGGWLTRSQREDATTLECHVRCYFRLASSIKACSLGDELLELASQEEENFDMELIPDVIEWYNQAVNFAREIGLVQEAIARSRLGEVYDKVLKNTDLAKVHFKKCFELVEALKPCTFFLYPWYNECTAALRRYQDEARARDEEEQRKSRAKVKEELADKLKDLNDYNSDAISLIKYLYLNYPPNLSSWEKPGEEDMKRWDSLDIRSKEYKRLLLEALRRYHPDKVGTNEHGKEREVLCEEITKMLNLHYESVKDI